MESRHLDPPDRGQYALRDVSKPIGVSAYRLTEALPSDLRGSLPTIEELEATLGDAPE